MERDEIRKDLEEYGVEEILAQYMSNTDAGELVAEYILSLQKERDLYKDIAESCECNN